MTRQSFSFQSPIKKQIFARQKGVSLAQSMLVIPVLFMLGAGILHIALLAQAKSNLEYATLMAARIGASTPNFGFGDGQNLMRDEIIKRMVASDPRNSEFLTYGGGSGIARICILRPNEAAFMDFSRSDIVVGSDAIPNDNLAFQSENIGSKSGFSIQEANILHLKVMYLFDSNVPFMNTKQSIDPTFNGVKTATAVGDELGRRTNSGTVGTWLTSEAVVVMQTPALSNATTQPYIAALGPDVNGDGVQDSVCSDFPPGY